MSPLLLLMSLALYFSLRHTHTISRFFSQIYRPTKAFPACPSPSCFRSLSLSLPPGRLFQAHAQSALTDCLNVKLLAVAFDVICSGLLQAIKQLVFALEANILMHSPAPTDNQYIHKPSDTLFVYMHTRKQVSGRSKVKRGSNSILF